MAKRHENPHFVNPCWPLQTLDHCTLDLQPQKFAVQNYDWTYRSERCGLVDMSWGAEVVVCNSPHTFFKFLQVSESCLTGTTPPCALRLVVNEWFGLIRQRQLFPKCRQPCRRAQRTPLTCVSSFAVRHAVCSWRHGLVPYKACRYWSCFWAPSSVHSTRTFCLRTALLWSWPLSSRALLSADMTWDMPQMWRRFVLFVDKQRRTTSEGRTGPLQSRGLDLAKVTWLWSKQEYASVYTSPCSRYGCCKIQKMYV